MTQHIARLARSAQVLLDDDVGDSSFADHNISRPTSPRDAVFIATRAHERSIAAEPPHTASMASSLRAALRDSHSNLTRIELALLDAFSDPETATLSRNQLAALIGCAPNSIPRAAKRLEETGYIKRIITPGKPTQYALTRNAPVTTTRNQGVTGNAPVTGNSSVTTTTARVVTARKTTTDMVVTGQSRAVEIPPNNNKPPLEISLNTETNPEKPQSRSERGPGGDAPFELTGEPEPRAKPRRRATERTLPGQPTPKMLAFAAARGFVNGTVAAMFDKWRNHHIARATEIADPEASWRTWVGNAVEFRERDQQKTRKGFVAVVGDDGVKRLYRKHNQGRHG